MKFRSFSLSVAVLVPLFGGAAGAIACPTQELYDNVNWCNNPDGKDGLQQTGGRNIRDGAGTRPPSVGKVVLGYLQCQHHQILSGTIESAVQNSVGLTPVEIEDGGAVLHAVNTLKDKIAEAILGNFTHKTGRPFELLQECSVWELWKAAFYATHSVDAQGNSSDRGPNVYKLEGAYCNSDDNHQDWVIEQYCHPVMSDYWYLHS